MAKRMRTEAMTMRWIITVFLAGGLLGGFLTGCRRAEEPEVALPRDAAAVESAPAGAAVGGEIAELGADGEPALAGATAEDEDVGLAPGDAPAPAGATAPDDAADTGAEVGGGGPGGVTGGGSAGGDPASELGDDGAGAGGESTGDGDGDGDGDAASEAASDTAGDGAGDGAGAGASAATPAGEIAEGSASSPPSQAIERPPGWVPGDPSTHELAIERLRGLSFPGSDLVVVETLASGSNYSRTVATYESEGLTIRGLLTIPTGERPATGWPVIIFNHGYIPPAQYRTTERYVAYQDAFARSGYITYKSDYRGHGSSEGDSASSRGSSAYLVDVLNAMASVARHPEADPNRIGMWGHSMGGLITLRAMVVNRQIKAGVIWAGVVASYQDLYNRLGQSPRQPDSSPNPSGRRGWRNDLIDTFGLPEENPAAWNAVSANAFLADISGPLQLHHGTADSSVPVEYSTRLQEQMEAAGKLSEIFVYQGDDHNLAGNLSTALARSVEFFDRHVKGGG